MKLARTVGVILLASACSANTGSVKPWPDHRYKADQRPRAAGAGRGARTARARATAALAHAVQRLALVLALASCAKDSGEVVGPFSGPLRRYVVDDIKLRGEFGDDLDGTGTIKNKVGDIYGTLVITHDATTHGADMIASGAISSYVELQADDLQNDESVGIAYIGSDGAAATAAGGRFHAGVFRSNRTRTTQVPGAATIVLPIFADADPISVRVERLEIDLAPDGRDGFDAIVRGGILIDAAKTAAYAGVGQMLANNPAPHLPFAASIDTNADGQVTPDEIANAQLLALFLVVDFRPEMMSVGFGAHLAPCTSGLCRGAAPSDPCHDRVRDGNETDVDCGGSCSACSGTAMCAAPTDCQSGGCSAGHCRAPTCSDGFRDGFESDVDCGSPPCAACQLGQRCATSAGCASNHCSSSVGTTGTCQP